MPVRRSHILLLFAGVIFTFLAVAGPAAPAYAQDPPSQGSPSPQTLTRANLWSFVDRRMTELDPLWRPDRGAYVTRAGYFSTRMIANALAVHSWAALAGHQGPARRDDRIAPMVAMLTRAPAFIERAHRPRGAVQFHLPGWTPNPVNLTLTTQHVALDAEVADALRLAWLARTDVDLPESLVAAITHAIHVTATSAFVRWPAIRLNQFQWQARLYAAHGTVTGDTTLLRVDYRRQLLRFLDGARHARTARTTNLNDGLGFLYLPNRSPSQRANRISTSEYGNIVFDGLGVYDDAMASGMPSLPSSAATLLRAWAERLLDGEWTHAGYLNWDTGLGFRRWHLARYWVFALSGLATLADQPILPAYQREWARWLFDRALRFYDANLSPQGGQAFSPVLFGVRSTQVDPVHGAQRFAIADPGFVAARAAATVVRQAAAPSDAAETVSEPPPLYAFDAASRRLAVTTPFYSAAVVDRSTAVGYGGADLARLFDRDGRPLGAIGSRETHGFGLRVTRRGSALLEVERGRRSAAAMHGPRRRRGTFSHLSLRAVVRGRQRTRVIIERQFRTDRIETRYLVRGPRLSTARLRLPVWSGQHTPLPPLAQRTRDGAILITVRQPSGRYRALVRAKGAKVRWRPLHRVRSTPGTRGILEVSVPLARGHARIQVTLVPNR